MPGPGFKISDLRTAVARGAIEWQCHALERMLERGIRQAEAVEVLLNGERIEDYPNDVPYPRALFLGWIGGRPLHVVAAYSTSRQTVYVITAYEPSAAYFEDDFRTRKKRS
jgi:hypothetical protein